MPYSKFWVRVHDTLVFVLIVCVFILVTLYSIIVIQSLCIEAFQKKEPASGKQIEIIIKQERRLLDLMQKWKSKLTASEREHLNDCNIKSLNLLIRLFQYLREMRLDNPQHEPCAACKSIAVKLGYPIK